MQKARPAVNAVAYSPDGSHLVCGTALGALHVWHFDSDSEGEGEGGVLPPTRTTEVQAHTVGCAVYALAFAETSAGLLLLSGADEEICGWRWADVLAAGGPVCPSPVLRLENPRTALRRGALGQLSETSALGVDAAAGTLYSAAGNGDAYAWDLSTQKRVATFAGVGEPLHTLALCATRRTLVTGGEDGAVRLWDVRTAQCGHVVTPATLADTNATAGGGGGGVGGWCGSVAVDDSETWLVAGWGDAFLCSLDLNTRACVACMPTAAAPTAAAFEPGSDYHIISIGAESGLYHWTLTGELETRGTCSSSSALGLAIGKTANGTTPIAVGGAAGTVDIFTDTSHRAFTLCL